MSKLIFLLMSLYSWLAFYSARVLGANGERGVGSPHVLSHLLGTKWKYVCVVGEVDRVGRSVFQLWTIYSP